MNLSRADGSVLIAYANSRADTNDILEELLEAYIKHQLNTNPNITEAQATELGIRPLTQKGTPTAAYTQGRLIAAKLTPQQFDDYLNGKFKGKALKQALTKPGLQSRPLPRSLSSLSKKHSEKNTERKDNVQGSSTRRLRKTSAK